MTARPFLKWAGGKQGVMAQLWPLVPKKFDAYHEPFLGGGAMFFELAEAHDSLKAGKCYLSDSNQELISTWQAIMQWPDLVLEHLRYYADRHSTTNPEPYYRTRASEVNPAAIDLVAARMIYLNKTCFNGLYRVNKSGRFNVPFGKYEKSYEPDEQNLRACSEVLLNRCPSIRREDFTVARHLAGPGDFAYIDPPYVPSSLTSSFTQFTPGGFGKAQQEDLARTFRMLDRASVQVLASNSDTGLVRELYSGFEVIPISRSGSISSKASKRQSVQELAIRNYS